MNNKQNNSTPNHILLKTRDVFTHPNPRLSMITSGSLWSSVTLLQKQCTISELHCIFHLTDVYLNTHSTTFVKV